MVSMELISEMCAQKQVRTDLNKVDLLCLHEQLPCSDPCLCAGLFAIRSDREYVTQEDFMKAVRKVGDSKKLESKLDYKPV